MIGLKSKLLAAAASVVIAFGALPAMEAFAASSYTQTNVYITTDGQVVDTFMGVPARYATFEAWSGEFSCADYVSDFYKKFYGVVLYDINAYEGRPRIYYPGHTAELRDVDKPIPGDIVQALDYSHVAIVKEVNGDEITLIEQNWKWNDWATGKPICTVNRKVGPKDNYYYRLYIDGVEQRLPEYKDTANGSSAAASPKPAPAKPAAPKVTSASAASITCDGFTVSASASGTSLTSVRIGTYLKSKGSDTAKWTTVKASGSSAKASAEISVSDFGNAGGTYVSVIEVTDAQGQKSTKTIETLVDRTAPVIENVMITGKTSSGYTVSCTVKDNDPIYAVFFPSWTTAGGKDDLPDNWKVSGEYSGSFSGSTVSFNVSIADHGGEYGEYNTCIYAYDSFGNCTSKSVKVNIEPEKTAKLDKTELALESGKTAELKFSLTDKSGKSYDDKPVWTSSDDSILTVKDGKLTAIAKGNATVTASAAGKSVSCTVTVTGSAAEKADNTCKELIADRCVISVLSGVLASNGCIDIAAEIAPEAVDDIAPITLPNTAPSSVLDPFTALDLLGIDPSPTIPLAGLSTVSNTCSPVIVFGELPLLLPMI